MVTVQLLKIQNISITAVIAIVDHNLKHFYEVMNRKQDNCQIIYDLYFDELDYVWIFLSGSCDS